MADKQPGSGYWQTGAEIGRGKRIKADPKRLQRAFERVGKALYKNVYGLPRRGVPRLGTARGHHGPQEWRAADHDPARAYRIGGRPWLLSSITVII